MSMKQIKDIDIINACNNEITMARAAVKLGIHYNTLIRKAKILGVYNPNQGGKGLNKPSPSNKIPLNDILNGLCPFYQTNKLRIRLINEGLKSEKCEICGITEWNGKSISFELDHIDGDRTNHNIQNLRIICPNCHSQTDTFRGKNNKNV